MLERLHDIYCRRVHEIAHDDLALKWSVDGHIPTGKLLDFCKPNKKTTEGELKDLSESARSYCKNARV